MKAFIKRAKLGFKNWVDDMRPPKVHVKISDYEYDDGSIYRQAVLAYPAENGEWWTIRYFRLSDQVGIYKTDKDFNWLNYVAGKPEDKWACIPEHLHEQVRQLDELTGWIYQIIPPKLPPKLRVVPPESPKDKGCADINCVYHRPIDSITDH